MPPIRAAIAQDVFASAYSGSYDPANPAANWLGDAGASDFVYGLATSFEVVLPGTSDLVIVVNTADPNNVRNGVDDPYSISIDAYADSSYDEPVVTPEPSSLILVGTGVLGCTAATRRRRSS